MLKAIKLARARKRVLKDSNIVLHHKLLCAHVTKYECRHVEYAATANRFELVGGNRVSILER
jgi:hypothetical protein